MDYAKLMEKRNTGNPFAQYLGIRIEHIAHGTARAVMQVKPEHKNPVGYIHGGCLYALADVVGGAAVASYGHYAVTISGEYHYLSPAIDTLTLSAVAKAVKAGKTICVMEVELFDDKQSLLGKGVFTFFCMQKEIEL